MNLQTVQELHQVLGLPVHQPGSRTFFEDVTEMEISEEEEAEREFARAAGLALKQYGDQTFATKDGAANIQITSIRGMAIDPNSETMEVVVPLLVTYSGKSDGAGWGFAEKVYERLIGDTIRQVAGNYMEDPKVTFLRRKKTDPFANDPRSLTLLRFRVE